MKVACVKTEVACIAMLSAGHIGQCFQNLCKHCIKGTLELFFSQHVQDMGSHNRLFLFELYQERVTLSTSRAFMLTG